MYAELHTISNFSFLRGASHPEELVVRAKSLGYEAIAITDECTLAGVVKAHVAVREHPIKLIIGSEFHLPDGLHLVLLTPNRRAYAQLSQLITLGRRRSPKGEYSLALSDLERDLDECIVLWIPDHRRDRHENTRQGEVLKALFSGRLWIALELFREADDIDKTAELLTLAMRLDLPMVATGDVHMHLPSRKPLQDVLTGIRLGEPVQQLGKELQKNREKYLRPFEELEQIYPREMLEESVKIAARCQFSLDELRYVYPKELIPAGLTAFQYLRELTLDGARKRWPGGVPDKVTLLVEKEFDLIEELEYEHYFLTVFDIVHFARSQNILCQGRGSAANSAVCYCLFITEVDPARMDVLFERFISKERNEPPDIDVDFEHERREEVIQYIYKRYGRDRAALTATLITYRPKSAIRDVGKALGFDLGLVDHLAKSMAWWDKKEALSDRFRDAGIDPDSEIVNLFLSLLRQILRFPRHLSQHVGGFVISQGPIAQLVPIENAAMDDRTVIQWDKDDLDALGLLKVDILALGMLTAIRKCFDLVNEIREGPVLSLATVPAEDPETYHMLQKGDSTGVFQVESRAQMAMLPRLKPQCFYDLVIEVAIVRPGPIQGNMVHPYLRRRRGQEPVTFANEAVRGVLGRTLGVPIFQEQVIKLAVVAAGFTPGEADQLRRAMAAWKRRGGLEHFEEKLVNGMLERGHEREFAERIFEQIKGFGEYGFPESHAASFALLVYVSAWLKRHEPAAFCCALLNSQPMGFYSPSQLVQDARRHGVEVRGVDANRSDWDHTLEPSGSSIDTQSIDSQFVYALEPQPAIRLGMRLVKGFNEEAALRIMAARRNRNIDSLETLARAADLMPAELGALARAGALTSLSGHRHQAFWEAEGITPPPALWQERRVAESTGKYTEEGEVPAAISPPTSGDDLVADYQSLGLTLGKHPMCFLRKRFRNCLTALELREVRHGRFVRVAGVVTGRQRPSTASGVIFMTLEDETGNINVVIWSSVLARLRAPVLQGKLVVVKGIVERENEVIHVVAGHVSDETPLLGKLATASRDFH